MNKTFSALLMPAVLLTLYACGDDPAATSSKVERGEAGPPSAKSDGASSTDTSATTVRSPAAMDTSGSVNVPAVEAERSQAPDGWQVCANNVEMYEVSYPEGWHSDSLEPDDACSLFDPVAFNIPTDSEFPTTALMTHYLGRDAYEDALSSLTDPRYWRTLDSQEMIISGRPAIRLERESTGEGYFERGLTAYGYVLDVNGRAFIAWTTNMGTGDYAAFKETVDQAVPFVRFR